MDVVDPGHEYLLDELDGGAPQRLTFVKREGENYPGNVGSHPGTTMQEVLRALVDRCSYVSAQKPCRETADVQQMLRHAIWLLEKRAARMHGRELNVVFEDVVAGVGKCVECGHVGCGGHAGKEARGGG